MRRVLRLERAKLMAQSRARAILAVCLIAPFLFAAATELQNSLPTDTLFGRHLHESGFAVPLVALGFAGTWAFPLLTSLVAGDIVASEDAHRTWSLLLTRSVTRGTVYAGKAVVAAGFALLTVAVLAVASLVAGVLVVGHQPLLGLDGSVLGAGRLTGLVVASWLCAVPPMLGFTALGVAVSAVTRSSVAGIATPAVAGFAMLLLGFLNGPGWAHALLLTSGFDAWHGLLRATPYYRPIVTSVIVSAVWAAAAITAGWFAIRHRDEPRG